VAAAALLLGHDVLAGPANARPLKARVALNAAIVGINFMLGSL
jgi:hypothetical protein